MIICFVLILSVVQGLATRGPQVGDIKRKKHEGKCEDLTGKPRKNIIYSLQASFIDRENFLKK
jgi:hypothetical protein